MIDLHIHLDGSLTENDIILLAKNDNVNLPTYNQTELKNLLTAPESTQSLNEYLEKFVLPLMVLQSEENLSKAVYLVLKRLSKQGIIYAEIRFAPLLHTKNGLNVKTAVQSALNGLKKACEDFPICANLILCCMRIDGKESENSATVTVAHEFLGNGVCAVDLAGAEVNNPTLKYREIFELCKTLNVPFTIHAGEASGAQNVIDAVNLGAKRIGHGVKSIFDSTALTVLKQSGVLLELCYTSNLQTKAVNSEQEYPLKRFMDMGIKVCINTDNTTVSDTNLKSEYKKIKALYGLENSTLKNLCLNAADGAFIKQSKKEKLKHQIICEFENWISE